MATEEAKTDIVNQIIDIGTNTDLMGIIGALQTKMQDIVSQYGADAVDLVLTLLQVKAGWNIVIGLILAAFSIKLWRVGKAAIKNANDCNWENFQPTVYCIVSFIGSGVLGMIGLIDYLFNFTTWLMLFNPKLGLAWMAISKVITF